MPDGIDGKIVRFAKREAAPRGIDPGSWKLLIVDDEPEVHRVTKLVLKDKSFFGRKIEFLGAHSGQECMDALRAHPDTAVVLLDVVMETDDAGLRLVKWIREVLRNDAVRIILRTGQPGRAPEERVIVEYEINDYKEKTELTAEKLFSAVVNAIRSYRYIREIQGSKHGMEMILNAAPDLFKLQSLKLFASGVLTQLISLFSASQDAAFIDISGFAARIERKGFVIIAGAGKFNGCVDSMAENVVSPQAREAIRRAVSERKQLYEGEVFVACMEGHSGELGVIYLEGCPKLEEIDLRLVSLYGVNVAAAFSNNRMYEELELRLREKEALIREIHHRVQNNLQIIISLIDLAESDKRLSPLQALEETKRRIFMMSLVYDKVLSSERGDEVDFSDCLDEIVATAARNHGSCQAAIAVAASAVDFILPLDKAVPCALLINEMVSLGYRRLEMNGSLQAAGCSLALRAQDGNVYSVSLESDVPLRCIDPDSAETFLLQVLVGQLKGRVEEGGAEGCRRIAVAFPGP